MTQPIDNAVPPDSLTSAARQALELANKHPYDGVPPVDAAHRAAQGVLGELSGRSGVGDALDDVDDDVKQEIVAVVAEIIRLAIGPNSGAV